MDCFCHFSQLAQPCFQPCSPQKPMVERQLHSECIKRSVCAAFHLKALRIHLVTWKNPFYLDPHQHHCLCALIAHRLDFA